MWVGEFPLLIHPVSLTDYIFQTKTQYRWRGGTRPTFPIPSIQHSASRVRSTRTIGDLDVPCGLTCACTPRLDSFLPECHLPAMLWTSSILITWGEVSMASVSSICVPCFYISNSRIAHYFPQHMGRMRLER
jgi:hypothetical protein